MSHSHIIRIRSLCTGFSVLLITLLLNSCTTLITNMVIEPAVGNLQKQPDVELVCEGAAAYLLMIDSLIESDPSSRNLLLIDRNIAAVEAAAGRESLRRLGGIAEIERTQTGTLSLKLFKQFRTGITFAPFLDVTGSSLDWVGKANSSDFGGPGSVDTYTSTVGFSLVIPFGRGHGRESTGAREQAANIDYEATRSALTHTAATSVLNTLIGYWDLVAAQETLAVQESSLELQTKLVEMVTALVQGDEMPRSEISRMKARLAEVEAQVEDARRRLYESRVSLASVIGLDVQHGEQAPMAAEGFPVYPSREAVSELPVGQLADLAMGRRYDLLSAQQLESSGKVLWRAAVIDLAPIADLDMRVSYSGLHEGGTVANGIDGSLLGSWVGPSAKVGFNYEQPIGNNVQEGRLEQQTAQYRTRAINSRNLARLIRANLVKSVGSLEEALAQLDSYREAAGYYQEAVDNEFEKLRYGRSTLIDAITTQRRQVGATLALVGSQKTVAQLLSQLKFESGTMVVEGPDGEPQIAPNLTSLPETTGGAGGSS